MPTLKKCSMCGQIYRLGTWICFSDIELEERRQLSWLIVTDGIQWEFVHCPSCQAYKA